MRRLLPLLLAAPLAAQAMRELPVQVTFVSGKSVFVDRGRESGIEPGDALILRPVGRPTVEARIAAISAQSARVDFAVLPPGVEMSTPGTVLVPTGRGQAQEPGTGTGSQPASRPRPVAHPPWTRPLDPSAPADKPLLAPAFGRTRVSRPVKLSGRAYANSFHTWDQADDRDSRYAFGEIGTDLTLENPLQTGGKLRFAGALSRRETVVEDAPDQSEDFARLERLSYTIGGDRRDAWRCEAGRFLQNELPEFGLLDGVELSWQSEAAGRFGFSFGGMPEPDADLESGDDLQVAVWHRLAFGETEDVASVIGLQKTWHDGDEDRDLGIWNFEARASDRLTLRTSTWIDLYGSGDTVKSHGPEVTEFHAQASYAWKPENGLSASFTHMRWPELLRDEFAKPDPDYLRDARTDRLGLATWQRLDQHWRIDARADWWEDQSDHGLAGELRFSARSVFGERHEGSFAIAQTDGTYTSGPAFRISSMNWWDSAVLRLTYELALYSSDKLTTNSASLTQHAVTAGYDLNLSPAWSLSITGDLRFGDGTEAVTLGAFLQTRF